MLAHLGAFLAKYLLRSGKLSLEDSSMLVSAVLDNLGALPYTDVINYDEDGKLMLGERALTLEEMKKLRDSAISALQSNALKIVFEHVKYMAVVEGINKGQTVEQQYFGRSGIWMVQNMEKCLKTLAQSN